MNPLADAMIQSIEHLFLHRRDTLPVQTSRGKVMTAFCGSDETVYNLLRSHVHGEMVAANCYAGRWFSLTDTFRVGSYLANSERCTCRELVIDLDGESHGKGSCFDSMLHVDEKAQALGLRPLIERSGSGTGWHVRFLLEEGICTRTARDLGESIAGELDAEVFPKSEATSGPGSMVWLPYWHGATSGANLFVSTDDFGLYVVNPGAVHLHSAEELGAAAQQTERRAKTSRAFPSQSSGRHDRVSSMSHLPRWVLLDWLSKAIERVETGSGRHNLAVWLSARMRDNRISYSEAVIVMKAFQEQTTGSRSHPFLWQEAESVLRHAYSRKPRQYDYYVAAELHREHWKEMFK